jgi:SRSO17 transposase
VPSAVSVGAAELIEGRPAAFRTIAWRTGTEGPLRAESAALRVRVGGRWPSRRACPAPAGGGEAWLVGEHRASGERKYYLTNHPADTPLETLAALIKARWVCEQMHQQMKDELGLDHFEGRSWRGLHHHALLCQLAFAFLQHLRLGGKRSRPPRRRTAAPAEPARRPAAHPGRADARPAALPALSAALRSSPSALNVAG